MYKQNKMTHVDIKVPKLSFLKMNITINIFCHSPILQHRPTLTLETSVSTTAKLTTGGNLCVEKKQFYPDMVQPYFKHCLAGIPSLRLSKRIAGL